MRENISSAKTPCGATVREHTLEHAFWKLRQKQGKGLAGNMHVPFILASGPEYGKAWEKAMGQRMMKSRQEVILEVTEPIEAQEMCRPESLPGHGTHPSQWSTHLPPSLLSAFPPPPSQNGFIFLPQLQKSNLSVLQGSFEIPLLQKRLPDHFSPLSFHRANFLLQSFGIFLPVVSIIDFQCLIALAGL